MNDKLLSLYEFFPLLNSSSQTLRVVTFILISSIALFIVFFIFTLLTLMIHQTKSSFKKRIHNHFTQWIIQYVLDETTLYPTSDILKKNSYRDALLDLSLILKGHERNVLFSLYTRAGFWQEDLEMLNNRYWYRRLESLVRLDQWQLCLGLGVLRSLMNDENVQIRQIALKNLSRTKDEKEARELLNFLSPSQAFYSTLYEVTSRLIRFHRHLVIGALNEPKWEKLHLSIARVIGDSRILEGVNSLVILTTSQNHELKESALISLGNIQDPRGIAPAREALTSNDLKIRLAGLKALFKIDRRELDKFKTSLEKDSNIEIRAWMNHFSGVS